QRELRLQRRGARERQQRPGPDELGWVVMDTVASPHVGSSTFRAIGTTNSVLVTRPEVLADAVEIAQRHLREVDRAVSRFRPDSEVSLLAERARRARAEAFVSPTFAAYLQAALRVARLTGGLVDPTV